MIGMRLKQLWIEAHDRRTCKAKAREIEQKARGAQNETKRRERTALLNLLR